MTVDIFKLAEQYSDLVSEYNRLMSELGFSSPKPKPNPPPKTPNTNIPVPQGFKPPKSHPNKLSGLNPKLQGLAQQLVERAKQEGISIAITSGKRSYEEQAKLYEQGRTTPGGIVTHAPPGKSQHNHGMAFDVAPLNEKGKPHWPEDNALWDKLGAIGESLGLRWGGRWKGKQKDRPHFELRIK